MFSMLLDIGSRPSELAGMKVDHIDMRFEVVVVKGRVIGIAHSRCRRRCSSTLVGISEREVATRPPRANCSGSASGGRLSSSGIAQALTRRADEPGIPHITPRQFRHTFAHQFLASGGNEGDLMLLAGWKSRQMVDRYGASAKAERAREAHRQHSPLNDL